MAAGPSPAQAYRLGGDEFCILSPFDRRDSEELGLRCAEALSEQGEGFSISCSYGWALLPDEVAGAEEALTLADTRMYSHKASGRRSTGRQVGDALVRALQARHPHLGNHLDGVAQLSEAVAARLGVDDEEVEQVRVAAELHDVGKLAIPDAILLKAGALDPDEWDFIKRHTVIGERIVAAAPALTQVARIVRSTHERFDGAGYPDGLAGEAIPLGARIIFACDSYDAMTRPRPYRLETRSRAEAIKELRRCAGGQFDPGVVEALVALLEESAARRLVPTPQRRAETEHRGPVRLIMMPDGQRHVEQLDGSGRNGA